MERFGFREMPFTPEDTRRRSPFPLFVVVRRSTSGPLRYRGFGRLHGSRPDSKALPHRWCRVWRLKFSDPRSHVGGTALLPTTCLRARARVPDLGELVRERGPRCTLACAGRG